MEKYREVIDLSVPSRLGLEQVAVDAAAALAKLMGFSEDRIEDLKTAVEEACINSIEHGNKENANIKVLVELIADDSKRGARRNPSLLPAPKAELIRAIKVQSQILQMYIGEEALSV